MDILSKVKGVWNNLMNKLFPRKITDKFNTNILMTSEMETAIQEWIDIYLKQANWLQDDIKSSCIANKISNKATSLALLDLNISVESSARAVYLQNTLDNAKKRIREQLEYGIALGGIMMKPNPTGIDYIKPDSFLPTETDSNGNIKGCIFIDRLQKGDTYYMRLEYHRFESDIYKISNKAFESKVLNGEYSKEIQLSSVEEWSNISPEASVKGLKQPLFAYYRNPFANNVDMQSPEGISIYANCIEDIKTFDYLQALFQHESKNSKKKVFVSESMLRYNEDGKVRCCNPVPDLIQGLEAMGNNMESFYQEFNPAIRIEEIRQSIKTALNVIETKCGFSPGTFSFDERSGMVTATEIEINQQETVRTIDDIRTNFKSSIEDLIYAVNAYADLYELAPSGDYKVEFYFKDITASFEADRNRFYQLASLGKYPWWRYLVTYEGLSEAEAKQYLEEAKADMDEPKLFEGE